MGGSPEVLPQTANAIRITRALPREAVAPRHDFTMQQI